MIKLYINESYYLSEDIEAVKKYYPNIDDNMFMKLISLDPTYRGNNSLGKYGKWLLNLYNKNNLSEDEFNEVTPLLNQFTTYRNRIQNKDLNSYKSLDALSDVLASVIDDDSMLTDRQKVRFLKNVKSGKVQTNRENDYSTDFEDSDWVVWIPHTHEASMKLGKGTDWCTAHENPEWYDQYTYEDGEEFSLYIMKNKQTGARYQYCDNPYRGYNYQFMDEDDIEVDEVAFMGDLDDRDFADYLNSINPDFFKLIQFANDLKIDYDADAVIGTMDYFEPAVVIPDGIRHIFEQVFFESDSIRSLYVPESLKTIGDLCFANSTLRTIDLDNAYGLSTIGFGAFKYCSDLHDYIFLPNIEAIFGDVFAYSGIVGVYIGDSLKVLGNKAFYGCENLKKVEIDDCIGGFSIRTQTFADCPNLTEIHLPKNIQRIEINAFNNHNKDLTIFTDSEWIHDNIESFDINLRSSDGKVIYVTGKGFVD